MYDGKLRPPFADEVGPGQESVWDYPRPPAIERVADSLRVMLADRAVAQTVSGLRVIETGGAPVYYFPPSDVAFDTLALDPSYTTYCEWKGRAEYFDVVVGRRRARRAAFHYPKPRAGFEAIAGYVAFYAGLVDACFVGEERARPQLGGFYAGWVTERIAGPVKGGPGTSGW